VCSRGDLEGVHEKAQENKEKCLKNVIKFRGHHIYFTFKDPVSVFIRYCVPWNLGSYRVADEICNDRDGPQPT
jgi:hypothetical protein